MTKSANDNGRSYLARSVDEFVGQRIRAQRERLSLPTSNLARQLCIPENELIDYEAGRIRVSASRLYDLSVKLSVSVAFFFQGIIASS
jgi:transcriptional regulator with XRE-family HTH domain